MLLFQIIEHSLITKPLIKVKLHFFLVYLLHSQITSKNLDVL